MTKKLHEAAKQALEALEVFATCYSDGNAAITALRAALAEQPADQSPNGAVFQEPVAQPGQEVDSCKDGSCDCCWTDNPVQEPVAWISGGGIRELQETGRTEVFAEKDHECLETAPLYTAPQPSKHPFLVRDIAELIGSTVPAVCNALEDMGIEPRRSTNAAVTPDEALAVARRLAQPVKQPLTDEEIDVLWAKQQTKPFKAHAEDRIAFARAIEASHGIGDKK